MLSWRNVKYFVISTIVRRPAKKHALDSTGQVECIAGMDVVVLCAVRSSEQTMRKGTNDRKLLVKEPDCKSGDAEFDSQCGL